MERKRKREKRLRKLYKKLKRVFDFEKESSDSGSEQEMAETELLETEVQPPQHPSPTELLGTEVQPPQHPSPTELLETEAQPPPLPRPTELLETEAQSPQHPGSTELLDTETLMAMGVVEQIREKGPSVHPEINTRMSMILQKGLKKEERNELMNKYLPFENVPAMVPPRLNPELCAAVSEMIRKRDYIIHERQRQTSAALSALGTALQLFLTKEGNKIEIIKHINDASKIMCDSIHTDTYNRRQLLIGVVNKDLKEALQGEPDVWLFGSDLGDKIKNTRSVQRSGQELKNNSTFKPIPNQGHKSATFKPRALNWRGPPRPSSNSSATAGRGGRQVRKPAAEKKKYHPRTRR